MKYRGKWSKKAKKKKLRANAVKKWCEKVESESKVKRKWKGNVERKLRG